MVSVNIAVRIMTMKKLPHLDSRLRFVICIVAGVAFGLCNDNLAIGLSLGVIFGLVTPPASIDTSLLFSNGRISLLRVGLGCFVVGLGVGVISILGRYLTGFTVGFFHGLFV